VRKLPSKHRLVCGYCKGKIVQDMLGTMLQCAKCKRAYYQGEDSFQLERIGSETVVALIHKE